jgi:hypothetical protein
MARKPKGYWQDFGNVKREILATVAAKGTPGKMPTITELRRAKRGSLVIAIHKYHGDLSSVARRLRLKLTQKPKGYWKTFDNLKRAILSFIAEQGVPGTMPTIAELRRAGCGNLASAIHDHYGDVHTVAQRLSLATLQRPKGYWRDFRNVAREIRAFVATRGTPGVMPTAAELRNAGQAGLSAAIYEYHGDFHTVARRLNLATRRRRKTSLHKIHQPAKAAGRPHAARRRAKPKHQSGRDCHRLVETAFGDPARQEVLLVG